jgi:hypothetical protein
MALGDKEKRSSLLPHQKTHQEHHSFCDSQAFCYPSGHTLDIVDISMAAIRSGHKFSNLKQQDLFSYSSSDQQSKIDQQGVFLLVAPGRIHFLAFLPFSDHLQLGPTLASVPEV